MILIAAFVVMYLNTIGGAAALVFYVSSRRPTRNNLQDFQATLPKFLQDIYFNHKQSAIYSRRAHRPGFEYLIGLTTPGETSFFSRAFDLMLYLLFVYGIILLSVSRYPEDGFYYFLLALTPLRVIFFGVKIKRDPDSYMPW